MKTHKLWKRKVTAQWKLPDWLPAESGAFHYYVTLSFLLYVLKSMSSVLWHEWLRTADTLCPRPSSCISCLTCVTDKDISHGMSSKSEFDEHNTHGISLFQVVSQQQLPHSRKKRAGQWCLLLSSEAQNQTVFWGPLVYTILHLALSLPMFKTMTNSATECSQWKPISPKFNINYLDILNTRLSGPTQLLMLSVLRCDCGSYHLAHTHICTALKVVRFVPCLAMADNTTRTHLHCPQCC